MRGCDHRSIPLLFLKLRGRDASEGWAERERNKDGQRDEAVNARREHSRLDSTEDGNVTQRQSEFDAFRAAWPHRPQGQRAVHVFNIHTNLITNSIQPLTHGPTISSEHKPDMTHKRTFMSPHMQSCTFPGGLGLLRTQG